MIRDSAVYLAYRIVEMPGVLVVELKDSTCIGCSWDGRCRNDKGFDCSQVYMNNPHTILKDFSEISE
jgi:hypothetical protein